MKICYACKVEKSHAEFYSDATRPDKLQVKCIVCCAKYQKENRERRTKVQREYRERDRDRARAGVINYRARKANAPGELTSALVKLVYETYGYKCLRCGSINNLSIDHIIPLTRGGTNFFDNLQPLCGSCNTAKGNRSCADYRDILSLATQLQFAGLTA